MLLSSILNRYILPMFVTVVGALAAFVACNNGFQLTDSKLKTVLVFGTFDALHSGHRYFLRQAKNLGDRLVVSLARDEFVRSFEGKNPMDGESERTARLRDTGLVAEVYLSDRIPGSYDLLLEVKPDLVCLGYDQDLLEENLRSWLQSRGVQIPLVKLHRAPTNRC